MLHADDRAKPIAQDLRQMLRIARAHLEHQAVVAGDVMDFEHFWNGRKLISPTRPRRSSTADGARPTVRAISTCGRRALSCSRRTISTSMESSMAPSFFAM